MDGVIKKLFSDKGYGFISVAEGDDVFFHFSKLKDDVEKNINEGDWVTFSTSEGKNGEFKAIDVSVIKKGVETSGKNINNYYGKPAYRVHSYIEDNRIDFLKEEKIKESWKGFGVLAGLILGWYIPSGINAVIWGIIIGTFLGWFVGYIIGKEVISFSNLGKKVIKKYFTENVVGICIKCGDLGEVTAIDGGFIGFQCKNCKSFWKKRDAEAYKIIFGDITCSNCSCLGEVNVIDGDFIGFQCTNCKSLWKKRDAIYIRDI